MTTDDLLAGVPHRVQVLVDMGMIGTADLVEELAAEVRALTARLDAAREANAELEQVGWYTPGMAGGPNIGSLFDGKFSDDDEPVYRLRAATADPTPQTDTEQ